MKTYSCLFEYLDINFKFLKTDFDFFSVKKIIDFSVKKKLIFSLKVFEYLGPI